LDVRQSSINTNVADAYVTAATGLGHVLSPDYNDFSTPRGVFRRWQVAQQPDKTRESSFTAHLKDYITEFSPGYYVSSDSRLKVYTGAHVLTVRWATNTATPKAIGLHTLINGKDTMVRAWRR
jgi:hypothetical protein